METVQPDGTKASNALRRLLDLKDTAQYGMIHLSRRDLAIALRQARSLVAFAAETVNR